MMIMRFFFVAEVLASSLMTTTLFCVQGVAMFRAQTPAARNQGGPLFGFVNFLRSIGGAIPVLGRTAKTLTSPVGKFIIRNLPTITVVTCSIRLLVSKHQRIQLMLDSSMSSGLAYRTWHSSLYRSERISSLSHPHPLLSDPFLGRLGILEHLWQNVLKSL